MRKYAFIAGIVFLFLPVIASAQNTFPLWIAVTQEYTYPGTQLVSTQGMIEQVIGEDSTNYIVAASDGTQLKLPKAYSKFISADEAVIALLKERNQNSNATAECNNKAKEIIGQQQAKISEYEKLFFFIAGALRQQQSNGNNNTNNIADAQQMLQLIQQMKELNKPKDYRQIPNQNRYEVNVNGR